MSSSSIDKKSTGSLFAGAIVDYEQSGSPHLALVIDMRGNKWRLVNESGTEVTLPASRIFAYPSDNQDVPESAQARAERLQAVLQSAEKLKREINLAELWEVLAEEGGSFELDDLQGVVFPEESLASHIALRRALLADTTYFKRRKNSFEPRSAEAVEQLKIKAEVETRKAEERDSLVDSICRNIQGESSELPRAVAAIEQLAALGTQAAGAKKSLEVVKAVAQRASIKLSGRSEDQAFDLLVAAGHFSPHENVAVYKYGRSRGFDPEVLAAADSKKAEIDTSPVERNSKREDLTSVHTVSIDSEETCDIDDALSIEETKDGYRIGIHISDVSASIEHGTVLHDEALGRATSIYCPDFQIPMFPPALSADGLSLLEGKERKAISFLIDFDRSFNVSERTILRSIVKVDRRLSYDQVDELLCEERTDASLDEKSDWMLPLLWSAAMKLEEKRSDNGAIAFHRREMTPVVSSDGKLELQESMDDSPSRKLVGELMILANETAALWSRDNSVPLIFRSQDSPDEDLTEASAVVPDGPAREYYVRSLLKRSVASTDALPHAGLGLEAYTHITSPIRRVIDLINQRQLMSSLEQGTPYYSLDQINLLKGQVEASLSEAGAIQREGARYWLFTYLKRLKLSSIGATIVKTDGPKPLAELDTIYSLLPFRPNTQKNKERGGISKRKGDRISLKIEKLVPRRKYIALAEE